MPARTYLSELHDGKLLHKTIVLCVVSLIFFSCGNTKEKTWEEIILSPTYEESEITCMGESCTTHDDCGCSGADICIPDMASMDPGINNNIELCTIGNCDPESELSCPEGWECYEIPMGNALFKDAKTICIVATEETL